MQETVSDYEGRSTDVGTVLAVPAEILFDFDGHELRDDARFTLDEIVEVLDFYGDAPVEVVGHTDSQGSPEYNRSLSQRRTDAMAAHLEASGVDPERLEVAGRGEDEPVADNGTEGGRERNRRVELLLRGVELPSGE